MSNNSHLKYYIVQAGGLGSRMEHLTRNKPKALVSIAGEPIIMHLMQQDPDAQYIIIADYKSEILTKYLAAFAAKYNIQIITTSAKGTCAGIPDALELIPENEPLAIIWCDLFFESKVFPSTLNTKEHNYIGLSNTFTCRWSFDNNRLDEIPSNEKGVAGVYIFHDRSVLKNIKSEGEFCRFLQSEKISFESYILNKAQEIGTLEAYDKISSQLPRTRPFNKIEITANSIIKRPLDSQGEAIAVDERAWYKAVSPLNLSFIPTVISYEPLELQKIDGDNIFKVRFNTSDKRHKLSTIIDQIKALHTINPPTIINEIDNNDLEAIIHKTKKRLDSVIKLIPHSDKKEININGRRCVNYYREWDKVENAALQYIGKTAYCFIHGDITMSNILYSQKTDKVFFIDPRGYYGNVKLFGDPDYDWAKLYYSIIGNYDQFNNRNFFLTIENSHINLEISSSNWDDLEAQFFKEVNTDKSKIQFYHAIIWLSLSSYAWDDYDSICGAFYNGIYLMQEWMENNS